MSYIGAHVSAAGGVENAPKNAHEIGATGFALFTKNQRQWKAKPLTGENISKFKENCRELGFPKEAILPHNSYLTNLGHPEADKLEKRSEEHTSELQSRGHLVCRLLLEKKKKMQLKIKVNRRTQEAFEQMISITTRAAQNVEKPLQA